MLSSVKYLTLETLSTSNKPATPHRRRPQSTGLQHRLPRKPYGIGVLIGVVAILIAAFLIRRVSIGTHAQNAAVAADYAAFASDSSGAGLPPGLTPVWPANPAHGSLSEETIAVQVGARIADLKIVAWARNHAARAAYFNQDSAAIAVVADNAAMASAFAQQLAAELDAVSNGSQAADLFRAIEREGDDVATLSLTELGIAERSIMESTVLRQDLLALGNWLETGRVAARRGDRSFFLHPEVRKEATLATSVMGLKPEARKPLERVRWLVVNDSASNLDAVERELTAALRALVR
jgi:hypothetical protein